MAILEQMLIFLFLLATGMFARHKGFLTAENHRQLISLVVNLCSPALIISNDLGSLPSDLNFFIRALYIIFLCQGLLLLCGGLYQFICRRDPRSVLYNYGTFLTNVVFIGIPFVHTLYGSGESMLYMAVIIILNNIFTFSYGIWLLKRGTVQKAKLSTMLKNPPLLAAMGLIVLFVFKLQLPDLVGSSLKMLGQIAPPLSMMLIGASLVGTRVSELLKDSALMIFTLLKMLVIPAFIVLTLRFFTTDLNLLGVCMISIATPTGVMLPMLTTLHRPELSVMANRMVTITTAVAVLTIPAVNLAITVPLSV
ncbi:MAG: AEC family transporter [Succinivibrio sp.]|nr:AEC family transporter [Succinivibrio sp.]